MTGTIVIVYGADWCPLTRRAIDYLLELGIPVDYVNIESDRDAAEWVRSQNEGKERKPTIRIGNLILVEPSNEELGRALAADQSR